MEAPLERCGIGGGRLAALARGAATAVGTTNAIADGVAVVAVAIGPTGGTNGVTACGNGPTTNGPADSASDVGIVRALEPGAGGGTVRGLLRISPASTASAVLGARVGAAQPSARLAIRSNVASPRWPILDTEHNANTK